MSASPAVQLAALAFGRVRCQRCWRRFAVTGGGVQRTEEALTKPCPLCGGALTLDTDYLEGKR